jgi:hypothetical protein
MLKASLSTHKGVIEKMFSPVHVTLPVATTINDFSQESVEELVQKTTQTKSSVLDGKKEEKKVEKKEIEEKSQDELMKDLETLAELKNEGIITEEEFNQKKKIILGL